MQLLEQAHGLGVRNINFAKQEWSNPDDFGSRRVKDRPVIQKTILPKCGIPLYPCRAGAARLRRQASVLRPQVNDNSLTSHQVCRDGYTTGDSKNQALGPCRLIYHVYRRYTTAVIAPVLRRKHVLFFFQFVLG